MDAPDENVNNNTPGSNAQAGGNTIEANYMAKVPAAASGAAGAANNAAVMDPTRALMARRQNKLIGALHSCGITLLVTADKFITKQGLDLVQSLMQLSKKHIKEMFNYHNQPLKTNMLRAHRLGICMFARSRHSHIMPECVMHRMSLFLWQIGHPRRQRSVSSTWTSRIRLGNGVSKVGTDLDWLRLA